MTEKTWTGTINDDLREQHGKNLPAIIITAAKTALRHEGTLVGEPRLVSPETLDDAVHGHGPVVVTYAGEVTP